MLERPDLELLTSGARQLGITLDDLQLHRFSIFTRLLLEWNRQFNLTRITTPREMVIKHYLDSLSCLTVAEFPLDAKVIDVGTGAGFPGIPIEIVRPDLNLTLLDSTRKRLFFLEAALLELGLSGVSLLHGRAEEAGHDPLRREFHDIAVSRAVARLNILAEYCLPLVRYNGIAILQKGPGVDEELEEAKPAIELLGGEIEKTARITLPESDIVRSIIVIR
ncbi:MAG: 16S rRNA (guanine(527)-N(7))-methyltransferase RsmG, partial [Armatimonadota bacterium]|nr:16S rRNA (guanine(527)-N(7))-methyltransferase RsmG [Armatimonadota bacterium]